MGAGRKKLFGEKANNGTERLEIELELERDVRAWLDGETDELAVNVQALLDEATWFLELESPRDSSAGRLYQRLVNELADFAKVRRRTAAISVSYIPMIICLVKDFKCSPAAVAKMLNESDRRLLLHWKGIEKMLTILRLRQSLALVDVKKLLEVDCEFVAEQYKDADLKTVIEIVAEEAAAFQLGEDFINSFEELVLPVEKDAFIPYMQVLYYLCVVADFSDHPLEYLYTFKPRGQVGEFCLGVFPSQLAPGGNAFLNNFKAVDKLSMDWARSRDDAPMQAEALVVVILGLSQLSYGSRRYLAGHIRAALLRFIQISCPEPVMVPEVNTKEQVEKFLNVVYDRETQTRGIIEQRVCDFLGVVKFGGGAWRVRGLGDPVNATNTSSRKLGDADFQNAVERRCVAIEAHAGRLTPIYIYEHLRTLEHNLPRRIDEWEGVADIADWSLEVVFVAHEDATEGQICWPTDDVISPDFRVQTYSEFSEKIMAESQWTNDELVAAFNTHVVRVLAADNVPYKAKEIAASMLI